jgi:sodium transport system permease protein
VNWTNVKLVFLREVRDQLRDRRTLFMVAVLPLLLYPALGLGMFQMTTLFREQPRTVVILGADNLPDPPLVEDGHFLSEYFDVAEDAAKLRVITDARPQAPEDEAPRDSEAPATQSDTPEQTALAAAGALRQQIGELAELEAKHGAALSEEGPAAARRLDPKIDALKTQILAGMAHAGIDVLILVPPGLREQVAEMNRRLADQRPAAVDLQTPRLQIVRNSADDKSASAYRRVNEVISSWEQTLLRQRLEAAQLPPSLSHPIDPAPIELAQEEQVAANMWSKLFPALLIIMSVTGAFYPAIDLGAGEKERGTMETLLISPATRTEIVTGKFFTVLLFSLGTALLNLVSMGLTGKHVLSMQRDGAGSLLAGAPLPPLSSLMWVLILAVPMAALFSSLSLGLAMFARSSKEGQYYLTPLLLVTMGLSVMAVSPMYEITPFLSVMPVVGPALLLKGLLLAPADPSSLYAYIIPVLVSSIGYSVLGLWWAVELFQREDILFRGDDQFELKAWIRHLLRDKEPLPSFSEGVFCFVLIMLLQFVGMRFFGQAAVDADATRLMQILMIQQLVIIATPALLMAIMLTTSVRRTLKLHAAPLKYFAAAVVLALVLRPLSTELVLYLQEINFLPALDPQTAEKLASMFDLSQAGWLVFLAFAVAPGICEEVAFRGFILSGLSRGGRTRLAIVLSALAFGIMHLIPQQVFNASLLGLVLGLIAVRSGSLLPGVVFHILYNGSEVLRNRIAPDVWTTGPAPWFFTFEMVQDEPQIGHTWLLLSVCAIVAASILTWLIREGNPQSDQSKVMTGQASWAT